MKLFEIVKRGFDLLDPVMKPRVSYDNRNELYFPDLDSKIYVAIATRGEARDDKLVALAQELDDRGQFGPAIAATARHLFRANDSAPLGLELGELRVEILVDGADAGVSNAAHAGCHSRFRPSVQCRE